jgi:hypothetical protein
MDEPLSPTSPGGSMWPNAKELAVLTIMEEHGSRGLEHEGGLDAGAWKRAVDAGIGYPPILQPASRSRGNVVADGSGSEQSSDDDDTGSDSQDDVCAYGPFYADVKAARQFLTDTLRGKAWIVLCKVHPLFWIVSWPALSVILFKLKHAWEAFLILTIFSGLACWKLGLHICLFSNVGRMKIEAYSRVDFQRLFSKLSQHAESPEAHNPVAFEDVMHFVICTNYKEDLDILREAIYSIAASKISKRQIGLVLAMEAREVGAAQKAEQLIDEVGRYFRHTIYTVHPEGLEGETPGKSANCRWAAVQLFEEHLPKLGYDVSKTLITVMDADSEFHPQYFPALTYHFLTAPGVAVRYNTIWQAPIVHYKNYHTQPSLVKLCSLVTTQHELANLADPAVMRLPYSTYSISAVLAKAVDGWDPDWISEDWHMCAKCFLASMGRLKVTPIFLPILNYAPEGSSYWETLEARWAQGKRHALGVSELVYFVSTMPSLLCDRDSFGLQRRLHLALHGTFMWMKMAWIHQSMAVATIMSVMNGIVITYFYRHNVIQDVKSFTFLANCIFQFFTVVTYLIMIYMNTLLYNCVADRIRGYEDKNTRRFWRRPLHHYVLLVIQITPWVPAFMVMSSMCEWLAAVKTAFTHKFHYEVALKAAPVPVRELEMTPAGKEAR